MGWYDTFRIITPAFLASFRVSCLQPTNQWRADLLWWWGYFWLALFSPPQCEREIDMLETWGTWWNTKAEASSLMLPYVSLRFQISALTNRLPNPTPSDFQLGKMSVVMVDKDGERPQCPNHGRLFLCGEGTIWIIICSLFDKPSGEWLFYQRHCARSNFQLGRLSLCQGQAQAQAQSQAQAQAQAQRIDRMEDARVACNKMKDHHFICFSESTELFRVCQVLLIICLFHWCCCYCCFFF